MSGTLYGPTLPGGGGDSGGSSATTVRVLEFQPSPAAASGYFYQSLPGIVGHNVTWTAIMRVIKLDHMTAPWGLSIWDNAVQIVQQLTPTLGQWYTLTVTAVVTGAAQYIGLDTSGVVGDSRVQVQRFSIIDHDAADAEVVVDWDMAQNTADAWTGFSATGGKTLVST